MTLFLPARSRKGLRTKIAVVKERRETELEAGRGEGNLPHEGGPQKAARVANIADRVPLGMVGP